MRKHEILRFFNALEGVLDTPANPRFTYAVARNHQQLRPVVHAIHTARASIPPDARDVELRRTRIAVEMAVKAPDGSAVMNSEQKVRIVDPEAYAQAMRHLAKEFQVGYAALVKFEAELEQMMNEDAGDVPFIKCPLDALPTLSPRVVSDLLPMLIE